MRHQEVSGSVLIVDDDAQVRRYLIEVLTSIDLDVEEYVSGEDFMRRWRPNGTPSCVLLDIRMPRVTGPEVHDWLRQSEPSPPVIFLTGYADVPTAVRAMRHGAFDFLEKPFNVQQLIERVNEALRLASAQQAAGETASAAWLERLTRREREVLEGLVAGKRNKVIAADLGISERTVETHRASLMHKTQAQSVADIIAMAMAAGVQARER